VARKRHKAWHKEKNIAWYIDWNISIYLYSYIVLVLYIYIQLCIHIIMYRYIYLYIYTHKHGYIYAFGVYLVDWNIYIYILCMSYLYEQLIYTCVRDVSLDLSGWIIHQTWGLKLQICYSVMAMGHGWDDGSTWEFLWTMLSNGTAGELVTSRFCQSKIWNANRPTNCKKSSMFWRLPSRHQTWQWGIPYK
jgi:hypothetical protein